MKDQLQHFQTLQKKISLSEQNHHNNQLGKKKLQVTLLTALCLCPAYRGTDRDKHRKIPENHPVQTKT